MATREAQSFCRICAAHCGVRLTIDDDDRIVKILPDQDNPMSAGYVCYKGLQAEDAHHGPARLFKSLKRMPDGSFREIAFEQAMDEIAAKLRVIRDRDGADAIAGFNGTGSIMNVTANTMLRSFMAAIGSPAFFSATTVDQSAKYVTAERLGAWAGGRPNLDDSDVAMIVGSNPIISHSLSGCLTIDATTHIKEAKKRGVKFIVIDPRFTETARYADVFLQPYPGEDPSIASGLLRSILANGWHDREFCAEYVEAGGMEALRAAVEPFTPEYVERRAGVPAAKLVEAAELFAHRSLRGSVFFATGPSMAQRSNLADHMLTCINVVCGRYRRAGERIPNIVTSAPPRSFRAEVVAPIRSWEKTVPSRIRGVKVMFGEMMACNLADEILTPGEGQIKALLNGSCGLVNSLPDQRKVVRALKEIELLVTIEPYMTPTAKLSHYVIAPKLQYERADLPVSVFGICFTPVSIGHYTPEILKPPPGSEVVDDWDVYWSLAKRLGMQLVFEGMPLDMTRRPSTDELIAIMTRDAIVPLEEIKKYRSGKVFDIEARVEPRRPEATARFDVMPQDIAAELREVAGERFEPGRFESNGQSFTHRLAVRRSRNVWNTVHQMVTVRARYPYNPAHMNPDDLAAKGLKSGDWIEIVSDNGRIPAIVEADPTLRPGVVTMSHGWGGLPDEPGDYTNGGSSTSLLVATGRHQEPINSMARLSGIPVNIHPATAPKAEAGSPS